VRRRNGSDSFCMGAAWKGVEVAMQSLNKYWRVSAKCRSSEMEVCVTLGQLGATEAAN
jgi:biotin synthase-like enzyme